LLASASDLFPESGRTYGREAMVAILNGIYGDYLARTSNPRPSPFPCAREGTPSGISTCCADRTFTLSCGSGSRSRWEDAGSLLALALARVVRVVAVVNLLAWLSLTRMARRRSAALGAVGALDGGRAR